MTRDPSCAIRRLGSGDVAVLQALNRLFAAAFEEPSTYQGDPPDAAYLRDLLAQPGFFALVAERDDEILGGLVAYELRKFERVRSEVYIYDLAVAAAHRRQGIATALIRALGPHAAARGAWVMFVQADRDDAPAVALYNRLGRREDVLHFDIDVT